MTELPNGVHLIRAAETEFYRSALGNGVAATIFIGQSGDVVINANPDGATSEQAHSHAVLPFEVVEWLGRQAREMRDRP